MRVLCRRIDSGLIPLDDQAAEELKRVPLHKAVYVEIKAARNPKQHRLFFALLKAVVDNTDLFQDIDTALVALKIGTGLVNTMILPDGQTVYVPRSISFANMDQLSFAEWFDKAILFVSERWLNMAPDELRREIDEMVG